MNSKRIRELAALHALKQVQSRLDDVVEIEVDGAHLDKKSLSDRQQRLEKEFDNRAGRNEKPNLIEQGIHAIEERADQIRKTIGRLKEGEQLLSELTKNTERVQRDKVVSLRFRNGSTLRLPVRFIDPHASQLLYRMNQSGVVSSYLPLVGHILPPLFATTSLVSSRVARWLGDDEFARAAQQTGQKQLRQSAAFLIPVADAALGALTLLKSHQDARATMREAVGAAEIAALSQQGPAAVPRLTRNPLDAWNDRS